MIITFMIPTLKWVSFNLRSNHRWREKMKIEEMAIKEMYRGLLPVSHWKIAFDGQSGYTYTENWNPKQKKVNRIKIIQNGWRVADQNGHENDQWRIFNDNFSVEIENIDVTTKACQPLSIRKRANSAQLIRLGLVII